jgi:transcriptional regulator with XRE-family HTH domain
MIVQIETGRSRPSPSPVRKIAAALGLEPRAVRQRLQAARDTV